MRTYLLIVVGGVVGANARYLVSQWAARRWTAGFPVGTLLVNVVGSFVLGLLSPLVAAGSAGGADARLLVGTGFCGAFTTFSTFAYEAVALARGGRRRPAALNVGGTVALCLGAAGLGVLLAGLVAGGAGAP
jgi:CrcB protein